MRDPPRRWLTRREAAKYLGRKPSTLATWATKGAGPPFHNPTGSRALYDINDLDQWIRGND